MKAEEYIDTINTCLSCLKMCRFACPVAEESGSETYTPTGKISILYLLLKGELEFNKENIYPLYMCLQCDRASDYCPLDVDVAGALKAGRIDAINKGVVLDYIKPVRDNIVSSKSTYENDTDVRRELREKLAPESNNDTLLFIGCTTYNEQPEIAEQVAKLLKKIGMNFDILGEDEPCCGGPLLTLGFEKEAIDHFKFTASVLNKYKQIITICPNCTLTFKKTYEEYGINIKAEIINYVEILAKALKDGKLKLKQLDNEIISFHDPCKYKKLNLLDLPREILSEYASKFKELQRNKEYTYCCGGGSSLPRIDDALANKIARNRLQEARDLGVTTLISACPSCKRMLTKNNTQNQSLTIKDLSEILE